MGTVISARETHPITKTIDQRRHIFPSEDCPIMKTEQRIFPLGVQTMLPNEVQELVQRANARATAASESYCLLANTELGAFCASEKNLNLLRLVLNESVFLRLKLLELLSVILVNRLGLFLPVVKGMVYTFLIFFLVDNFSIIQSYSDCLIFGIFGFIIVF